MNKLKKVLKKYFKESLDSLFIDQISSILFALLVAFLAKHIDFLPKGNNVSEIGKLFILIAIFLIVYIISVIFQIRPHRYKFHIKSIEMIIEYDGDEITVYETYHARTNRLRAEKMYTRRNWFSDEAFHFEALTKGYEIKKRAKVGDTHEFDIVFPEPKWIWQTIDFKTKFVGQNLNRQFENFYWYDVIAPTDSISMEVRMRKKYCGKNALLKSFLHYEDADGSEKQKIPFNGVYRWNFSPKLGWSYVFEWEWSDSEKEKKKKLSQK